MPPKVGKKPLFKNLNKRNQSSPDSKDRNLYGKPVKRHKRCSIETGRKSSSSSSQCTVRPPKKDDSLFAKDNDVSMVVSVHCDISSPESEYAPKLSGERIVTEKLLDNVLFGSESAIVDPSTVSCSERPALVPVVESSPITSYPDHMADKLTDNDIIDDFGDDILSGLCPEDLNFSLNHSGLLECVRTQQTNSNEAQTFSHSVAPHLDSERTAEFEQQPNSTTSTEVAFVKSSDLLSKDSLRLQQMNSSCHSTETFYGLPLRVKECFDEFRGIKQLYDWQQQCLSLASASSQNLIYSLPTSGGKTLVAEVLILKELLVNHRDVLLILPFVSIVQEKVRQLIPFSTVLGFAVEEFAASKGKLPPRQRRKKKVLYIATIEKANGLVNSLIELERMSSVGLTVVDELHMLGDGSSRGATLESCLAKLQHCSPRTRLVGMSATLGNMTQVASFLKAQVFSSDFRPVELMEQVKLGRCVYRISVGNSVNFDPLRDIRDSAYSHLDPDQLTALVTEVVPDASCLIFCPTKKSCQNVALLLTKTLPRALKKVCLSGKQLLLQSLGVEAFGVCPTLAQTVPYGVAYHHSGLTADERRVIEEGYLDGVLCVIACTSTLAAGVNLPARRVILRSPYIGSQLMTRSQYKQMVGRAGRSGLCDAGDSILILSHRNKDKVVSMLAGPYEVCESSVLSDGGATLLSLLLNIIGLKIVQCFTEVQHFFKCTLLFVQHDHSDVDKQCHRALARLVAMGYITQEPSEDLKENKYLITPLGRAAFKGCLPVEQAHVIYREMMNSLHQLVLSSDLHLLFLATPTDLSTSIQPNWMVYFQEVTSLGEDELSTAELLGIKPGYLSGKATGSTRGSMSEEIVHLYHRFYITLILHSVLKLTSSEAIWRVAERFHCSRGFLQSTMNSTASHASCLVHFTAELPELWSMHVLLPTITKKLAYSSNLELVPLMEVSGVRQENRDIVYMLSEYTPNVIESRARQLLSIGITTPYQLASSDPEALVECMENLFPKQAKRLIQAAKALLIEQAEALMEEAEELKILPTHFDQSVN